MDDSAVRRALIAADAAAVAVSFALAWLLFDEPLVYDARVESGYALLLASPLAWVLAARALGLYEPAATLGARIVVHDLVGVGSLMTMAAWSVVLLSALAGKPDPDIAQLFTFWVLAIAGIVCGRLLARAVVRSPGSEVAPRLGQVALREVDRRLIAADVASVILVCVLSWPVLQEPRPADSTAWASVFVAVAVPAWVALAATGGLYVPGDEPLTRSLRRDLLGVVQLASLGAWVVILFTGPGGEIDPDIPQVFAFWAATVLTVVGARALARRSRGGY